MKQQNFKIVSLLTVFTIALNILSAFVLLQPAKAATTASDTMSRIQASTASTHTIALTTTTGTAVEITFPAGFTGTAATATATCTAAGNVITCTTVPASVVVTGLTNPAVGSYNIAVDFTGDTDVSMNVITVDSDQVTVTGYINTTITFDIDTDETQATDCAFDACFAHSGEDTIPAGNYTVDLGNLTTAAINNSGDAGVLHSDGKTGDINYIMLDLSTNAYGGAVVSMLSANGRLDGPGDTAYDIPAAATIAANTPGYGVKFNAVVEAGTGTGLVQNTDCEVLDATYCEPSTTAFELYNTSGDAIQDSRVALEVAAAIDGTMPAGTYTDTLTFIATATY